MNLRSTILAIVIPTYMRPEQLVRCLRSLVGQLNSSCHLYILDNASEVPAEDIARPIIEECGVCNYTVIRNSFNIGGVGNVINAYRTPTEPWVWVLGDDDIATDHSISRILSRISKYPDALLFTFEVGKFREMLDTAVPQSIQIISSSEEFFKSDAFICASLISSGIYNMEALRDVFRVTYEWGSSYFPHLALVTEKLESGNGKVVYFGDPIIAYVDDGEPEPNKFDILLNIRNISTMLSKSKSREALMESSIVDFFINNLRRDQYFPKFVEIFMASSFKNSGSGDPIAMRCRSIIAETFKFDSPSKIFPEKRIKFIIRYVLAIWFSGILGWLVRLLFKIKSRNQRMSPSALSEMARKYVQPRVP